MKKTTRTVKVRSRFGERSVESPYTDAEACELLAGVPGSFAADLRKRHEEKTLSAYMRKWAHVLVVDHEKNQRLERNAVEALVQDESQMDAVLGLFAGKGGKPRSLQLTDANGWNYAIEPSHEKSTHPDCLIVKANNGMPLGRISHDGLFFPLVNAQSEQFKGLLELLQRFAASPLETVKHNGHVTGRCAFCNSLLTDPRSVELGYGKTCALDRGLPWHE